MEVAYNEELSNRIDEISELSEEIIALKSTIEEILATSNSNKLRKTDSSLEFEILRDISRPRTGQDNHQHDLMSELEDYDKKLKEKDLEISSIDSKLKEKEQTIEKQQQVIEFSSQFLSEIEAMNKMIDKKMKGEKSRSQDDDSFHLPKESLEPETMQDFAQVIIICIMKVL